MKASTRRAILLVAVFATVVLPLIGVAIIRHPYAPHPLEGASINLLDSPHNLLLTERASSSSSGTFEFKNSIAEGEYTVSIDALGFLPRQVNATIREGMTTDIGDVVLAPSGILIGKVVAPSGEGVRGVYLEIWSETGNVLTGSTVTSEDGSFLFEGLSTQTYYILTRQWMSSTPGFTSNLTRGIACSEGKITRVTIHLGKSGAIAGTVLTHEGVPVEGLRLTARCTDWEHALECITHARTDSEGRYNFTQDLPEGIYKVNIDPPAHSDCECRIASGGCGGYSFERIPIAEVAVHPGQTSEANFTVPGSASISGKVIYENGTPASGNCVIATRSGESEYWEQATANAAGEYIFDMDIEAGEFHIRTNQYPQGGRKINITSIQQHVEGFDLVIPAPPEPRKAWLTGKVSDAEGTPIPGATLWARFCECGSTWACQGFSALSGRDGNYSIDVEFSEGATAYTLFVSASAPGYESQSCINVTVVNGSTISGIDFTLEASAPPRNGNGTLRGRVVTEAKVLKMTYNASPSPVKAGQQFTLSFTLPEPRNGTLVLSLNTFFLSSHLVEWGAMVNGAYAKNFTAREGVGWYYITAVWLGDDTYWAAVTRMEVHVKDPN